MEMKNASEIPGKCDFPFNYALWRSKDSNLLSELEIFPNFSISFVRQRLSRLFKEQGLIHVRGMIRPSSAQTTIEINKHIEMLD